MFRAPSSRTTTAFVVLATSILVATFIMTAYLMAKKDSYETKGGDEVFSNSSRVNITRSSNPLDETTIITLQDVHGYFGFANYTCDPQGPVQTIPDTEASDAIGFEETWIKVLLRDTIENTGPNVFELQPDDYTVTVSEVGPYFVEYMVTITVPLGYNGTITSCAFVEVDGIGLDDYLRRTGFRCDNLDFPGTDTHLPLLILSGADMFSVTGESDVLLRYLFVTDVPTDVFIAATRLKLTKV